MSVWECFSIFATDFEGAREKIYVQPVMEQRKGEGYLKGLQRKMVVRAGGAFRFFVFGWAVGVGGWAVGPLCCWLMGVICLQCLV